MKEILKLWYFSVLVLRRQRVAFFFATPLLLIIPPIITLPMILSKNLTEIIAGYILLILFLAVIFSVLWMQYVGSFFAIIRFKKRFSFLPPASNEGRIAMQSRVDSALYMAALKFFLRCDEEKRLISSLVNKKEETGLVPDEIRAIEISLDGFRKDLKNLKKQFWQKHAAAKSDLLPAAFEAFPSIHNYETNPPRKTVPKKKRWAPPSLDMVRHTEAIDPLHKRNIID